MNKIRLPVAILIFILVLLITHLTIQVNSASNYRNQTRFSENTMPIYTGLDVLIENDYYEISGLNVGLITNHSAISRNGEHILHYFVDNPHFNLTALFSPEHGLKGTLDAFIPSQHHNEWGIPIYSLYGDNKKPTPEMLQGLDILVFDVLDIGARYYTYITTMALCMEAASENDLRFLVLDRPNMVGGSIVCGDVPDDHLIGYFTSVYPIPTRHGMTIGELALLFNEEYQIGCKLGVIEMQGWSREMLYEDTLLPWINPSPNIRDMDSALIYVGMGILESTNLSVGRGTDAPFHLIGAPFIDKYEWYNLLMNDPIPGLQIEPISFIPESSIYRDQDCQGLYLTIVDREAFDSLSAFLIFMKTLYQLYPREFVMDHIKVMVGNDYTPQLIRNGLSCEDIISSWEPRLSAFISIREQYLLY